MPLILLIVMPVNVPEPVALHPRPDLSFHDDGIDATLDEFAASSQSARPDIPALDGLITAVGTYSTIGL
jgi:hypothetical protein